VIERGLLETNDAHIWAQEFVLYNRDYLQPDIDWEGLMIGWFANAMAAQEYVDKKET
jgi:hypothetical protein